jgi:SAM-dependent methyltransferase
MGFNPGLLDMVGEWARDYGIRPGAKMLDIGASELFCSDDPESLNRLLAHFGATPYAADDLARMANRAFAGDLFERAGLFYEAVDISSYPRTMVVDLNRGRLPFWKRSRYDLVMNCGTTEHVLNQLNAFRLIHDACKVGGVMYHGVPMAGDFSHGMFNYTPLFFVRLAEANGYEIMKTWGWASDAIKGCEVIGKVDWNRPFATQDAWINILLRRARGGAFCVPLDCIDHVRST